MRARDWASVGLVGAAVATAVVAVGGAFRWTQALVAVFAIGALATQLPSRRVLGRISPLVVGLGLAAALTAISLIPLPSGLRELLDPVGSALRDDGSALLGLSAWPGVTRDAPGSLRGLVYFLILLGIAIPALRMATSERGRFQIAAGVGALCGLTAVIVGIHELFGITRLYGIYEVHARPNVLGPLLNENHLGELMALGTCVAIGLVMYRRQRTWMRVAWMLVVLACGATTAASYSRGSILAMPIGALVCGGILIGQRFATPDAATRRRRRKFATSSLPIGIVAVCVVIVVVYSSAGRVSDKIGKTTLEDVQHPRSKFMAWKSASTLVEESPWVGVGRGGFESSLTRVHPASGVLTFSYAENEYVQAVVDWGIPGALALALVILWFAAVAIRRWRDGPLVAGAIGGLTAIAIQSNVDFGMELLGVAAPVVVIAATLAYVPLREEVELVKARALRVAHIVALAAGALLLLSRTTTTIEEDHAWLVEHHSLDDVHASLDRHPLDYYGYAVAAEELTRSGDPRSIRLLNHAMRLHPTHPDLHRIAARLLFRGGHPDQATIEYAATLRATADPQRLIAEIAATFPAAQAAAAIPIDFAEQGLVLKTLQDLHREDISTLWLTRILKMHPNDVRACNLLYEISLSRGDLDAAEAAGRSCVELMPDHQTRLSLSAVLLQKQGYAEVIRLLQDIDTWHGLVEEKAQGWLRLCDAYLGMKRWDDATQCIHHLDASGAIAMDRRGEITKRLDAIQQGQREQGLGSAH